MALKKLNKLRARTAFIFGIVCSITTLDCDQILAQTSFGESEARAVEIMPNIAVQAPDSTEADTSPRVEIFSPVFSSGDSIKVHDGTLRLEGRVVNPDRIASLEINFDLVSIDSEGNFSTSITLRLGLNILTIIARDTTRAELIRKPFYVLYEDAAPPELHLFSPLQRRFRSDFQLLQIAGTLSDQSSIVAFTVNDGPVDLDDDNGFVTDVQLEEGAINIIRLTAEDENGLISRDSLKVAHDGRSRITPSLLEQLTVERGSLVPSFNRFEQFYVIEPETDADSVGVTVQVGDLQSVSIFGPGLPSEGLPVEPDSDTILIPLSQDSTLIEVRSMARNASEVLYYLRIAADGG